MPKGPRHKTREEVTALIPYWSVQAGASRAVNAEVRAKRMPRANTLKCTDCPKPAHCYDHRDYTKPFDVEPVCAACNGRRGPGKF